ncbi:subtilisin-like protease 8 [Ceratobasidium sp. AG-Ba]|nr:subtilisin-like protease 8 [Ceratobasidium sp. AG-Ba]QRW03374.1 subtilisin-like protease 8 [Ceratobasidium sp. AG-Ba]
MHLTSALATLALVIPALGVPTRVPITKRAGPVKPNSFIVTFKDAASKDAYMKTGPSFTDNLSRIHHDYTIINGFAATILSTKDLDYIRGTTGVESVEPDGIVSINYEVGLDGFDPVGYKAIAESETREKRTDAGGRGEGTRVIGIDTGVYIEHNCFGGRATWGPKINPEYEQKDGNGHGTRRLIIYSDTAGSAVVLGDDGSGTTSDVMMGVQKALEIYKNDMMPSVATMSLGGAPNKALDSAVRNAIKEGLHFSIAAGNSMALAETSSPASVEEANTIGAVDYDNKQASFSNFGPLIDVWYYGVGVESAWIAGPDSTKKLSGTSMATPGVAGLMVVAISNHGQKSPANLSQDLKNNALEVVQLTTGLGTSNNTLANRW